MEAVLRRQQMQPAFKSTSRTGIHFVRACFPSARSLLLKLHQAFDQFFLSRTIGTCYDRLIERKVSAMGFLLALFSLLHSLLVGFAVDAAFALAIRPRRKGRVTSSLACAANSGAREKSLASAAALARVVSHAKEFLVGLFLDVGHEGREKSHTGYTCRAHRKEQKDEDRTVEQSIHCGQ